MDADVASKAEGVDVENEVETTGETEKEHSDSSGGGAEELVAQPAEGLADELGDESGDQSDQADWQVRAKKAEALAVELGDRLGAVEAAAADLQRMVREAEQTRAIERELLMAGVVDLQAASGEVASLVKGGAAVMEAVMRVKERQPRLFARRGVGGGIGRLYATGIGMAETGRGVGDGSVASAARVARESGDRRALLAYLQLRRARG